MGERSFDLQSGDDATARGVRFVDLGPAAGLADDAGSLTVAFEAGSPVPFALIVDAALVFVSR